MPVHPAPLMPLSVRLRVARILWFSISLSTVLIAGVYAYLLSKGAIRVPRPPEPVMLYVFAALATGVGVVSFVLPRAFYAKASQMVLERTKDRSREALLSALLPVFQTPLVLSLALSEAVSLFGLTLGMMGFGPEKVAPFFAAGTILALARFPSESAILGPVESEVR